MDDDLMEMSPLPRRRGLDRLPLHMQLVTLIGGLVVLVALCGAVAVALVVKLGADGERLADRSAYTEKIAAAALDAKSVANDERGYLITGEEHFRLEAERGISDATMQFRAATAAATTPSQLSAASVSGDRFATWTASVRAEFAAYHQGHEQQAIRMAIGPNRALRKHYERSLSEANALALNDVATARHTVTAGLSRSVEILLVCLVICLLLAIAIGVWLSYAIVRPMQNLTAMLAGNPSYFRAVGS